MFNVSQLLSSLLGFSVTYVLSVLFVYRISCSNLCAIVLPRTKMHDLAQKKTDDLKQNKEASRTTSWGLKKTRQGLKRKQWKAYDKKSGGLKKHQRASKNSEIRSHQNSTLDAVWRKYYSSWHGLECWISSKFMLNGVRQLQLDAVRREHYCL